MRRGSPCARASGWRADPLALRSPPIPSKEKQGMRWHSPGRSTPRGNHPRRPAPRRSRFFRSFLPLLEQLEERVLLRSDPIFVSGPDAGERPVVRVYDAVTHQDRFNLLAYDSSFHGGVRVAVGDVNGDG